MSVDGAFDKLVRDLDDAALAGLGQALEREASQRRQQTCVQMEDIHPKMSAEEKLRATEQIARVLRGEE